MYMALAVQNNKKRPCCSVIHDKTRFLQISEPKKKKNRTCTVSTEESHCRLDHSLVQRVDSTKDQSDQEGFQAIRQQGEQKHREVGQVPEGTQDWGQEPPLRSLSHTFYGRKQQDGLQHLQRRTYTISTGNI